MLALIVANVRRRMARTSLTAAGIAVGVAAVAALLALSAGLDATAAQLVHLGKADLGMFQADASDPTASLLPLSLLPRVRNEPFVSAATPIQLVTGAVARDQSAFVFGLDPKGFVAGRLVFSAGSGLHAGAADIGDVLAGQLHLRRGNEIRLGDRSFEIAAVYPSGVPFEDMGVITTLADAQALAGRTAGEATTFAVRLQPQTPLQTATRRLRRAFPGVSVISDPTEAIRAGANTELISKAVLLIVVLVLGTIVSSALPAALGLQSSADRLGAWPREPDRRHDRRARRRLPGLASHPNLVRGRPGADLIQSRIHGRTVTGQSSVIDPRRVWTTA